MKEEIVKEVLAEVRVQMTPLYEEVDQLKQFMNLCNKEFPENIDKKLTILKESLQSQIWKVKDGLEMITRK